MANQRRVFHVLNFKRTVSDMLSRLTIESTAQADAVYSSLDFLFYIPHLRRGWLDCLRLRASFPTSTPAKQGMSEFGAYSAGETGTHRGLVEKESWN